MLLIVLNNWYLVRFHVLKARNMEVTVVWDVASCSVAEIWGVITASIIRTMCHRPDDGVCNHLRNVLSVSDFFCQCFWLNLFVNFTFSSFLIHARNHILMNSIAVLLLGQTKSVLILLSFIFSYRQNINIVFFLLFFVVSFKSETEFCWWFFWVVIPWDFQPWRCFS